jgi:hypothetical protein
MSRGLDLAKAETALKRAAHKALHDTREERSGRFLVKSDQEASESVHKRQKPPQRKRQRV